MARNQQRICNICGEEFPHTTGMGRPPAQCSPECKAIAKNQANRDRYCTNGQCLRPFTLDDADAAPPYFCSEDCRLGLTRPGRRCLWCHGQQSEAVSTLKGNRYCSWECYEQAIAGLTCEQCGNALDLPKIPAPWVRPPRYCGQECRSNASGHAHAYVEVTEEAQDDYVVAVRAHFRNYANGDGQVETLPVVSGDYPFYKVDGPKACENLVFSRRKYDRASNSTKRIKEQFCPTLHLAPSLREAIAFREQGVQSICADPIATQREISLALHYWGILTGSPVPGPGYVPTLAQVFPWLTLETRAMIMKTEWRSVQRRYSRKLKSERIQTESVSKLRTLREKFNTGDFLNPPKGSDAQPVTYTAIRIYQLCSQVNAAYSRPDFSEYLSPNDEARLAAGAYTLGTDGDLAERPPGPSYALASAHMTPTMVSGRPTAPGRSKAQRLAWWKHESHPVAYADWFVNELHPGTPSWIHGTTQYEENY